MFFGYAISKIGQKYIFIGIIDDNYFNSKQNVNLNLNQKKTDVNWN